MPSKTDVTTATKTVTCPICQKKFSRTDHFKRHHLRHSGVKPYSCIFCDDSFTRSNNLRDHYPGCSQRQNREIPEASRGGRRSHACDSCTSMKLGCDGNNPCKRCHQKSIVCKFSRLQSKSAQVKEAQVPKTPQENKPSSDRGSIKFLLNSGTASFIECFRFPSSNERGNIFNFPPPLTETGESSDASTLSDFFTDGSENSSTSSMFPDPFNDETIDWSTFFSDASQFRMLSSPFSGLPMQADDIFAPLFLDSNFTLPSTALNVNINPLPSLEWEPASFQSAACMQMILDKAISLQISPQEQADITHHSNFLFAPSMITRLISLYFQFWQPHCPIIHQPTFDIETAPVPLLIAMILMGSMFSQVDREVNTAKRLLDLGELVVYSMEDLTEEYEIKQMMRASTMGEEPKEGPLAFLALRAAYLIVDVQFWSGSMVGRKRAIEMRFPVVAKVARKLGLTKIQHELEDSIDETLWIEKETRIRFINFMTLLDCAFTFFANFPRRLTISESNHDLPCEESYFASAHPFSEPGFTPSRNLTVGEAFRSFFEPPKASASRKGNPLGLNPLDMFISIHLLYIYTHTHITHFSHSTTTTTPSTFPTSKSNSPSNPTPATPPRVLSDSNLTPIKAALSHWRTLWTQIRANIPSHAWANLGFFRNGYHYWLVTQLLVNNRGSVELMCGMEVGCEDTLRQLKGLLGGSGGGD